MKCDRLTNVGRVTNHEMAELREQKVWRDTCWVHVWSSLSDAFHPRSEQEWREHQQAEDEDE